VSISTHVLDAVTGTPARGVAVVLSRLADGRWLELASRQTDADGRVADLSVLAEPGDYRLTFDTGAYFAGAGLDGASFYPEVIVSFRIIAAAAHHHVPLLLSPYAYSTYRGS
jgi:5-hydroxyisourate hydrolase